MNNHIYIYQAFECATVIFEAFINYQYISAFFDEKGSKNRIFLGYAICCLGSMLLSLFSREPGVLIAYTIISFYFLELLFYKTALSSRIFSILFFIILMMGSDFACTSIVFILGNIDISQTKDYGLPRVFYIVTAKLVQIVIVKLVGTIAKWKKDKKADIEVKYVMPLFLCQVFSAVLTYEVFITAYKLYGYLTLAVFLSLLGIMYVNIIIFWYFDNIKTAFEYKSRNEAAETKLQLQKQYYEMIEQHQQDTNALWHDMKKHMDLMNILLAKGLQEDTEQYFHELEEQIHSIPEIVHTSQPIISALLTEELRRAKKENIHVEFDIKLADEIKINPVDLCILLGNTFDNAIEACKKVSPEDQKSIELSIIQKGTLLLIEISNPYNPEAKEYPRAGRHGYGLKNVRKVVDKYNGDVKFYTSNRVYRIAIVIP